MQTTNRWGIAVARVFMQIALGAVYAWSAGIASMGNALGRVFWAWVSDFATRRMTFLIMFLVQVVLFWFYPSLHSTAVLLTVTFIILMCYGGGILPFIVRPPRAARLSRDGVRPLV